MSVYRFFDLFRLSAAEWARSISPKIVGVGGFWLIGRFL
jgi:hypothetical protein